MFISNNCIQGFRTAALILSPCAFAHKMKLESKLSLKLFVLVLISSTFCWFQLLMNYSVNQKYLNKLSRKIHYLYLQKRLVLSESVSALGILGA